MEADTVLAVIAESGVNPFPVESAGWMLDRWPLAADGFPVTPSPVDFAPADPNADEWSIAGLPAFRIMVDESPAAFGPRTRVVFDQQLISGEMPILDYNEELVSEIAVYALLVVLLRQQAARDDRYAVLGSTPADAARRARARSQQYTDWAAQAQAVLTMFGTGWADALTPAEPPNKHRKKVRSLW